MPTTRSSKTYELAATKKAVVTTSTSRTGTDVPTGIPILRGASSATKLLPSSLTPKNTRLHPRDQKLLHSKQNRLRLESAIRHAQEAGDPTTSQQVAEASLVFAQEAAGTAICISPEGLLLTCSHCIAESREELDSEIKDEGGVRRWLLFASGCIVQAELVPRAWDERRDLALLRIVGAQSTPEKDLRRADHAFPILFPFVRIAEAAPKVNTPLICVGHPGSEDLEASTPGLATGYDVLHISSGRFRGYAKGQDLQDNSEIGALRHNCWSYWGHSGAPLVERLTGRLVGLHSSWDDETGMRRGVALEAIRQFLDEWTTEATPPPLRSYLQP